MKAVVTECSTWQEMEWPVVQIQYKEGLFDQVYVSCRPACAWLLKIFSAPKAINYIYIILANVPALSCRKVAIPNVMQAVN